MVIPTMQPSQDRSSWLLNPGCVIEIFLDRVEKLRSVVLPDTADNSPDRADIEAHLEQIGG